MDDRVDVRVQFRVQASRVKEMAKVEKFCCQYMTQYQKPDKSNSVVFARWARMRE